MFSKLARQPALRLLTVGVVLTALYVVAPAAVPSLLTRAAADQPVSGAFALGGGLGGQVDPRTGQFSLSMPLTTVASRGTSSVTYSLSWDQSRAGAGVDRYEFGAGWSLGTSFVDPSDTGTLYAAGGGAYGIDDDGSFASGLQNYPLEDMHFARASGQISGRRGVTPDPVAYDFTLTYDDGRVDYFDSDGNLVTRTDRFCDLSQTQLPCNRTDLEYEQIADNQFQPTKIVDAYGQTTTFTVDADTGDLHVRSPRRSDGVTAETVVSFNDDNQIATITDPNGQQATFLYSPAAGSSDDTEYLYQATGPSGATSLVGYTEVDYGSALSLIVAQTLDLNDGNGNALVPQRSIDLDPNGDDHNYTGFPTFYQPGTDGLFASADPDYTYTTEISNGASSTQSTYDSLHRLISRAVYATSGGNPVLVQTQSACYSFDGSPCTQTSDFAPADALPGNFAKPTTTTIAFSARSGPKGVVAVGGNPRSTATSNIYDDHGRVVTSVDAAGTTTVTTYDPTYGLVTSSIATGADGTKRTITNTLSTDKKTILSTTRVGQSAGTKIQPRNLVSYGYDTTGQLTSRTVGWAPGAAPPDNGGGPAETVTTYETAVNEAAATKTVKAILADHTTVAQATTTVLDLVTGLPVSVADPAGRISSRTYDAGGRVLTSTPPTGLTTTFSYTAADPATGTPATKTVTEADKHKTTTTYDLLGRTVLVTDNVSNGEFVSDATTRILSRTGYSPDGSTVTGTDRQGRTSTTSTDPLGRTIQQVGPTGVTKGVTYDDVSNTVTTTTTPDNATDAFAYQRTRYDDLDRPVLSSTTYPPVPGSRNFLADPVDQTAYDGIGRPTAVTAANLTTVPDYSSSGGQPVQMTVSPTTTNPSPGEPVTSATTTMLDTTPTVRTLQQGTDPARRGTRAEFDAAGNVSSITDPNGKTTTYTPTPDGRIATRTTPEGVVTKNVYDAVTGQLNSASTTTPGGTTATTSYTYVQAPKPGAGLIETITDASGTITYGYDADRNRTSVNYPDGAVASQAFDDDGQLANATDVTGAVTSYAYYTDGTLKAASQTRGKAVIASVGYLYDGLGRVTTTTRGNGVTTGYTYTPDNLLKSQTTTNGQKQQIEAHSYLYDRNHNLVQRTDTTAALSRCTLACGPGASTYGTWTTTYRYDAFQRLLGSSVYAGSKPTSTPVTSISYTLDVAGNVKTTTRSTRTTGPRPIVATQTTTDTIDDAGQLTQRQVGSSTTAQTFDPDGRVLTSLSGSSTSYRPDGLPSKVTTASGAVTTLSYWPDGTRRRATTADPVTGSSSVEFHYAPDGALINDTSLQGTGASAASASASYLLTTGREARTLQPNTNAAGTITSAAAPVVTGAGVGYLLRDRHTSVTALVDASGAVTNTYAYSDYGAPALLDGRPGTTRGAQSGVGPGRTNPFQYNGSALRALYTDTGWGTMATPTRFYDPSTGRFTSRDPANVHNRYVGFDTNPIMKVDPSGLSPVVDMITDIIFCVVFAISIIATGGAAAVAGATIVAAAEAGAEVAAAVVRTAIWETVATAASTIGLASQTARLADDISVVSGGKHFFDDDTRQDLSNIATAAGGFAGASGLASAGWDAGLAELDAVKAGKTSSAAPTDVADVEGGDLGADFSSTVETPPDGGSPGGTSASENLLMIEWHPTIDLSEPLELDVDEESLIAPRWSSAVAQKGPAEDVQGVRPNAESQQAAQTREPLMARTRAPRSAARPPGNATLQVEDFVMIDPDADPIVNKPEVGVKNSITLISDSSSAPGPTLGRDTAAQLRVAQGQRQLIMRPTKVLAGDIPIIEE